MRPLKLTLAYEGTAYAGWQIQPDQPTLQAALEKALHRVTGEAVRVLASGRTDAGVHALGQVVGCATNGRLANDRLQSALNAVLPPDMRVLRIETAVTGFHAIRDAVSKRYRYVIQDGDVGDLFLRRYCWFVPGSLDEHAMHRAAQPLVGTHDYSSFEASGAPRCSSIRTVRELTVAREAGAATITVEIEADGFLYNMVRNIVGTLVEVGKGRQAEGWAATVLAAGDRRKAGRTAPARGLFLVHVDYGHSAQRPPASSPVGRSFPVAIDGLD